MPDGGTRDQRGGELINAANLITGKQKIDGDRFHYLDPSGNNGWSDHDDRRRV